MNAFKKRPIRLQLLIIFVLFVMMTVLVMNLTYFQSKTMIYEKNRDYSNELLDKITQYIQSQLDNIDGVVKNTIYSPDVHNYLQADDVLDKMDWFQKVDTRVTLISQVQSGINDFTIIGDNGNNLNFMSDIHKRQAVMEVVDEISQAGAGQYKPYYAGLRTIIVNGSEQHFFMLGTRINNIFPVKGIGYLIVILDLDAMFPKFNKLLESGFGRFYVLDRNGVVCSSNDISMIGKKLEIADFTRDRSGQYVVQSKDLTEIQGKVVNIYSEQNLFRGLEEVRKTYLWIFALFIPFMLFLLWVISRNIINPILTFMQFIKNKQVKNIYQNKMRLQMTGYHEIMVMADKFNEMLDEIDLLTDEVISSKTRIMTLELLKKQAEFAFLKQQVNPHFLYNLLESLKGVARDTSSNELLDMITALGKMLRYSIKGQDEVTFGQELEIAKSYLKLQQFRFSDRFDVIIDIEETILDCRIIKMILQPILENAITHGLESKMTKGHLQLEGHMTSEGDIIVRVKDDGVGMREELLTSLHMELAAGDDLLDKSRNKDHLGIVNVHSRLRAAYGEPYGLNIFSMPGKGTEVVIHIPGKSGGSHV